jgi:hypothetical protein
MQKYYDKLMEKYCVSHLSKKDFLNKELMKLTKKDPSNNKVIKKYNLVKYLLDTC